MFRLHQICHQKSAVSRLHTHLAYPLGLAVPLSLADQVDQVDLEGLLVPQEDPVVPLGPLGLLDPSDLLHLFDIFSDILNAFLKIIWSAALIIRRNRMESVEEWLDVPSISTTGLILGASPC